MTGMDLDAALAPYRERSNREILAVVQEYERARGSADEPSLKTLEGSRGVLAAGKRYRYAIACLGYQALTGSEDFKAPARPAAWLELYHLYTLFLDDIMDEDDRRRTFPSAWSSNMKRYRGADASRPGVAFRTARHRYGVSMAILDALRIRSLAERAIEGATHLDVSVRERLLEVLTDTDLRLSDGQGLDIDFETRPSLPEADYERMSHLKTGVLYVAAATTGAILAGAPPKRTEALEEFARRFSIAFQDRDDLLGSGVVTSRIGGSSDGDIRRGKRTRLYAITTARLPTAKRRTFVAAYGKGTRTTAKDVKFVRELVREHALGAMMARIRENVDRATSALRSASPSGLPATILESLALAQLTRQS